MMFVFKEGAGRAGDSVAHRLAEVEGLGLGEGAAAKDSLGGARLGESLHAEAHLDSRQSRETKVEPTKAGAGESRDGRGVSGSYVGRDEMCPISTG